jgi:hypothetical protein
MKKKLAILMGLMMVMCFTFAACGGGSNADLSDSKYVGTWEATSITAGDVSEDLGGGVYNLTLNGDGTGVFYSKSPEGEEETDNITWVLTDDGFKTKGDTKLTFTDDGDGIKANVFGAELHFARADEIGPDNGAPDIGTQYGYMGQDPVECAVWKYLCEDIAVMYDRPDEAITVPVVQIIKTEEGEDGDTEVYGDFWVFNYVPEGDTLKFVSGGAHPGRMHVVKDGEDYKVTSMDVVEDGGNFESSAKEIFGDDYDKFMQISSDSDAREALRLKGLADYVKTNGLAVSKVQDYDADPVDLDL